MSATQQLEKRTIHPWISFGVALCPICKGVPKILDRGCTIKCSSCGALLSIRALDLSREDFVRGVNFVRAAMFWNEWARKENELKNALAGERRGANPATRKDGET